MIASAFTDMSRLLCFLQSCIVLLFSWWFCTFSLHFSWNESSQRWNFWTPVLQIFSRNFLNTSRCLGCSASLLKASFLASIHSWVDCEAGSEKSSKDIENLEWSREFLLFVFVRSRTGGLWFISCQTCFTWILHVALHHRESRNTTT